MGTQHAACVGRLVRVEKLLLGHLTCLPKHTAYSPALPTASQRPTHLIALFCANVHISRTLYDTYLCCVLYLNVSCTVAHTQVNVKVS